MKGNFLVRFLGGWGAAMPSGYPVLIRPDLRPADQSNCAPAADFALESGCFFILHMQFPRCRPPFMAAASAITPLPSNAGPPARLPSPGSVSGIAVPAACPFSGLVPPALLADSHDTSRNGNRPSTIRGAPQAPANTPSVPTSAALVSKRFVELLNSISR